MRVSVGIHKDDIASVIETYNLMSERWFTHATPTLFNAGTPKPQMSSCFLLTMKDDSIDGIYETLKQCAKISQSAGGIGLSIHNIRATGSYIKGTNGTSNGIVPMLRVFNDTARYVDQGGGKRKGSFAIYLEPWHDDVFDFLDLRKNHGKEEMRARDLFTALWIPDLFMKRVEAEGVLVAERVAAEQLDRLVLGEQRQQVVARRLDHVDLAVLDGGDLGLHVRHCDPLDAIDLDHLAAGETRRGLQARLVLGILDVDDLLAGLPFVTLEDEGAGTGGIVDLLVWIGLGHALGHHERRVR